MARLRFLSLLLPLALACGDDDSPADGGASDAGPQDVITVDIVDDSPVPDAGPGDVGTPDVPLIPGTDVTIQTFNLALAGAFVPNEAVRRDPVIADVAALDADIVCLQEVWEQSDKDRIVAEASANFPHILSHVTDFETPLTSPEDQSGMVPPPFDEAPCAAYEESLNAAVDCLSENCSTMPGSEDGQAVSSACAAANCVAAVGPLLAGDPAQQRCYSCLTTQLPTESFANMRELCTTETNATVAFRGQSSTMILSKYPLTDPVNFVLPGSWNQRVMTVATATLPSGAEVDVYCNHLTPIFESFTFPYTGQYGDGMVGAAGWAAEQLLQVEKIIDLVNERSATRPGVILGDLNTGTAELGPGLTDEGPLTFARLSEAFVFGVTEEYEPLCTYCMANENNDEDTVDTWIDHIFLHNLNRVQVLSTVRTFDEATVDIGGGVMVQPSDHYGIESVITIPDP